MNTKLEIIHNGAEDIDDPEFNTIKQSNGELRVPLEFNVEVGDAHRIKEWTIVFEAVGDDYESVNTRILENDG